MPTALVLVTLVLVTLVLVHVVASATHAADVRPTHDQYDQCLVCTKCIGHEPECPNEGT